MRWFLLGEISMGQTRNVNFFDFRLIHAEPIYRAFFTCRFVSSGWRPLIYSRPVPLPALELFHKNLIAPKPLICCR